MAKFLTTTGNSYSIEQIIVNAKEQLTLVTPFLKLSNNFIERLSDANKRDIKITLIYGKSELGEREKQILNKLNNLRVLFFKNLHAKCYFNERSMIITSMNLYEFSEINNREMGIIIKRIENNDIYEEAYNEVISIKNSSIIEKERVLNQENLINEDNFDSIYLKKLLSILKREYPNYQIDYDETITMKNFPYHNLNLKIGYRIELKGNYKLKSDLRYLKKEAREYSDRLYWGYNDTQINIYPERKFNPSTDNSGIIQTIDNKLNVINYINSILSNFNSN